MKLGSLKNERDGILVVVSRDNTRFQKVPAIANTMQAALDEWETCEPKLKEIYNNLNADSSSGETVILENFHSPLPRAYAWMDGSAFIQHVKLVRKARNAPLPETLETDPLMYQGGSDDFLAPTEDIPLVDEKHGLDFEGEVAVVTGDIPLNASIEDCAKNIRLLMSVNDVSLRGLIPAELAKGFGFLASKPSSAFGPFAVTPDELGEAWKDGIVHLNLDVEYNGEFFGKANGREMFFSFPRLLQHASQTRRLRAGTILGSGTISNEDTSVGSSCLAEKRMLEKINEGEFKTPFMKSGDTIKIEMLSEDGNNLFGTIEQKVVQL
ncbi:MAG: fumarylacetoacetate hydrolase family protein [Bdellovibrionales bacterium]